MNAPCGEYHPVYWGLKSVLVRSHEYNSNNEYCALLRAASIHKNSVTRLLGGRMQLRQCTLQQSLCHVYSLRYLQLLVYWHQLMLVCRERVDGFPLW